MKKIKLSQTQQYFLGILMVAILGLILLVYQKKEFSNLLKNSRYTTGEITEYKKYLRRQDHYIFYFTLENQKYKREIAINKSSNLFIGKRYFVIFEEGNPENSMLIPFLFVPDSITEAPPEGWKEPPVPIDKERISSFLKNY